MKVTFDASSPADIAEARRFLDYLDGKRAAPLASAPPPPPTPVSHTELTAPPMAPTVPPPPPADPLRTALLPPPRVAPAPPAPSSAPTSEWTPPPPSVDAAGEAWDAKVHASSKAKTKDGKWRRKRGAPAAPAPALSVVPPTAPPPPAADGAVTWASVVQAFQARSQGYTQEHVQAALQAAGIVPTELHDRPDLYGAAVAALDAGCPV